MFMYKLIGILVEKHHDKSLKNPIRTDQPPGLVDYNFLSYGNTFVTFFGSHFRIFVTPFYVGPLLVQSFFLNRRRNEHEVRSNPTTGNYEFHEIDTTSSSSTNNPYGSHAELTRYVYARVCFLNKGARPPKYNFFIFWTFPLKRSTKKACYLNLFSDSF